MIIKSNRISTGASRKRLVDHLLHGEENDHVEVLRGSERDIADFWRDAQVHGAAKSLRVWIIAPSHETSRDHAFEAVDALAKEFGFDPSRATVVEHGKNRVGPDAFDRHWHVVIGEVDPSSGRVLSSSHDRARQEYVARTLEARFGHPFVLGAHTTAVLARMRRDGRDAEADGLSLAFEAVADEGPPREAFTTRQHQAAKRQGVDLPKVREAVADAWRSSTSLECMLASLVRMGLELSPGDVEGEWVVRRDGTLLGSLRRLVKVRKGAFENRMKELIHGDKNNVAGAVRGGDCVVGDPTGKGGSRRVATVRRTSRPAIEQRRELPGHHCQAPEYPGLRDRGDAPAPGSSALCDDGAGDSARDETRYSGGLIEEVAAFAESLIGLVQQAEASSMPAATAANVALDEHEARERLLLSTIHNKPSGEYVDRAKAAVQAERDKQLVFNEQITALNSEIGTHVLAQRARQRSVWRRWLPDPITEAALVDLRQRRSALMEARRLAEGPLLRALAGEERAEEAFSAALVRARAEYGNVTSVARARLTMIARARRLLAVWPSLAYVGVRKVITTAVRIERVKRRGWDQGSDSQPTPP